MKVNGKSKTPITAAQSKRKNGESGGKKARTSQQASKSKINGVKSAVLERISDGILAFDAGMNYTYLNERAGELLGRRAEELVGKNLEEEYAGASSTPFMEACQRALETQSVVWLNEYFSPTDRWLEGRIYPSDDGVSVVFQEGMLGGTDSDQTRMLSMFPEQNPAPVMRLSNDGVVLYANPSAAALLKAWKREERSSDTFLKIQELLPQVIEKNANHDIEIENQGRVFLCQLVPFPEEGYINLYFRDITDRKQAEEALRAIVNQPGAGITRTDRQGRYTFVNRAFCDMLGYSESELTERSIWDVTDPNVLEKNRRLFEHMLATGEGYQSEKRLVRSNGAMLWASVGSSPLRDADGRIVGSTAVVVDITRRKRAEESLLESARRSLYLSSLSDTIRPIESPERIQLEAACLLGAHLKASRVAYAEVDPDGRFLVQDNYADDIPNMSGWFSITDLIPQEQLSKFKAGRTILIQDVQSDPRLSASQKSVHEGLSVQSQLILPFVRDEKVVAALLVQQSRPRMWKSYEISLVEESAERMQAAIERARAEAKLRENERKFNIIFKKLPFTAILLRPGDNIIMDVNEEFEAVFGVSKQEALGKTTFELNIASQPKDRAYILAELQASVAIRDMELELHTKPRGPRIFLVNTDTVNIGGSEFILQTAQDITERRRAEEEAQKARLLAEHENLQLRALLENLPVGVMVTDAAGTPLLMNSALDEIWHGRMPLEALPDYRQYQAWRAETDELLGPEDWPISLALSTGEVQPPREFKIERFDGTTGTMLSAAAPIRDRDGRLIRAVAVAQDITERKGIEQALARERTLLERLVETMPVMVSMYDPETQSLRLNAEFERVIGWKAEEVSAASLLEALYPDPEYRRDVLQRMAKADRNEWVEVRVQTRDERTMDSLWSNISILDGQQLILGIALGIDITERKRAEAAVRASEEKYRRIVETANEGIWEIDKNARTVFANARMAEMLGYSAEEMIGRSAFEFVFLEDQQEGKQRLELAKHGTATRSNEFKYRRKDGTPMWGLTTTSPRMDEQGNFLGSIAMIMDITERKRAEEALLSSEERMRLAIESNRMVAWEWDPQTDRVTTSDNLSDVYGLSSVSSEAEGFALIWQEDLPAHREKVDQAMRMGGEYRSEFRITRPVDGRMLWLEERAIALTDPEGQVIRLVGIVIDITERKKAEQELAEYALQQGALYQLADELSSAGSLEEMFKPALNAILSALQCDRASILLFDHQDVMSFVAWQGLSDEYRRATNGHSPWTRAEKNARPISMDDVATADLSDSLRATIQAEGIGALAFIPLINQGRLIGKFMVYYNAPHVFNEAQVGLAQTIAHQLASHIERKQAQETLRQSEERFARFMLHLPGLAWIKDVQGRYVFANAAAQKAFNVSQEELYGRTDWEIFPNETAAQFNRNDDLAIAEEKGVQVVETLPQMDGVVHHSLVTKFPILGLDGRPAMIGGTAFDITERVEMEDALRMARAKAENSAYRMTQLQKITAGLSQIVTPSEIARMVVEEGTAILGAVAGSIMLLDEETQTMEIMYSSIAESVSRPFARFPLSLDVPSSDAIRSGKPVWIESRNDYLQRYPHLTEHIQNWGYEAALAIPMVYKNRLLGTLTLSFKDPKPFSLEDQEYLLTLARQAAQALERARVETALRLDAVMMENVSAGIYLVSAKDGTILHTNPKFDTLFGYQAGEVIGKPVSILNTPTKFSPEESADRMIEALKQDGIWQGEILSQRKDGSAFWCSATISTFEHSRFGTVWVAARQDITERKQVEESLRESEERYRAIISQATAGIVRKDPAGRLLYVNQAFCNMLGSTDSELLGRPIWELTHEEDAAENRRLYNRLIAEGIPFQLEKRLIHKNGSILWANVSVSPVVDVTGRPHSAVSVYVDITGRKQAENRLALLSRVSELARETEDPDELLFAVSRAVGEHFQARRTLFNEIDLENDIEIVHRDYCRDVDSVAGEHRLSAYSSITTAEMMVGKTVVNRDSKRDPRTAADYERSYVEHGERAYVAVPLMHEGYWVASLWMSDDKPRQWDREDVSLLEAIAERTWIAAEKLRVDRALRDSEERLRVTFNTTAVGFATLTPDTRFMDVNEAFCQIVGYSPEELLQISYEKLIHPQFDAETMEQVKLLLSGEIQSFTIEKIFIRRDGTEIWAQNNLSLVRDAAGNPSHLIVICQEVTERKRAEQALYQMNVDLEERVRRRTVELQAANEFLRESEATSRLILESMPDAIVIIDREGQIVHANRQVETLFGYSPGEVMGLPVETLVPSRLREHHIQQRFNYKDQRNRRIMGLGHELFGRRNDESEFPVEVMLAPIDNSTNWDILVAIRDNTKQRQAQEALRNNEEKLRTLFEILPVGISFLDKEGKVSELNSALAEILELPRNEILAGSFTSRRFIRADGAPMPPSEFASTRARAEQRTVYNVETGIVKTNGEITWTSVNAAPVQVADVEAVIVTVDITERKKAEEALRKHRERLKVLSRRLVEVQEEERHAIARELHDRVGQNLAALTLNLNILRNQLSSEVLDMVGTRLNDSVNLVNDILTITRSVMADLRPNVLDDYGLDAALDEYAERFTQRYGIRVITHTPANPTPRLDPGVEMTLLRIAQEALTNIAKHSHASQAVMSIEKQEDEILMTVEDNGLGILSWQKVNQSGSHGLRIMRERAEAFGGYLKIHSTYKNGTKIEVKIPLTRSTPAKGTKERKS